MPSYEWTQVAFWKHPHLSYLLFIVISVLGGLLGLDHLYLRSPLTALLKALSNMVAPGFWWLYDILQATAEKGETLKYGLTTPFVPSSGIGAGMFTKGFMNPTQDEGEENISVPPEEAPPSVFWFIGYLFLSFIPIGLDHLLVGDTKGGLLKLWLTVMFLFPLGFLILPLLLTPLTWGFAGIWSFYNMFRIFFRTDRIFTQGVARFGVPGMEPYFMAYGKLSSLSMNPDGPPEAGLFEKIKNAISSIIGFISFGWIAKIPLIGDKLIGLISGMLETLARLPIVGQFFAILLKIKEAVIAVKDTATILVKSTIPPALAVAGQVKGVVEAGAKTGPAIISGATEAFKKELGKLPPPGIVQAGGGLTDNGFSTIALISVVSIIATLSIGKFLFNRYYPDRKTSLEKAGAEAPPTRSEFAKEKEASKGADELPPEPEDKDVKAANE
jgi:hypothetical protein